MPSEIVNSRGLHRGRIDTLGLDENNTPVLMEYKKGSDSGVMSQAVSYLSWLCSARHEFEALVKEQLGSEAAESIDWRNPRMVCIAASFSHHDRVAVHRLHERIDLVRYRVFDGGLLGLPAFATARPDLARNLKRIEQAQRETGGKINQALDMVALLILETGDPEGVYDQLVFLLGQTRVEKGVCEASH
ncbi:PDDEXK family nuclease [Actinacidiphila oryziradicis]|uniref:hypothetical protein n=1 Tax=Actinacidiphila oryziradicis TaxID=2571141 RepID=UPI001FE535E4